VISKRQESRSHVFIWQNYVKTTLLRRLQNPDAHFAGYFSNTIFLRYQTELILIAGCPGKRRASLFVREIDELFEVLRNDLKWLFSVSLGATRADFISIIQVICLPN